MSLEERKYKVTIPATEFELDITVKEGADEAEVSEMIVDALLQETNIERIE